MNFFDDIVEDFPEKLNIKPFHSINKNDDKEVLEWCTTITQALEKESLSRNSSMRHNLEVYKGSYPFSSKSSLNRRQDRPLSSNINKFVVNHLHDMTETRISQLSRVKPSIDVLPSNDEYEDRSAARTVKYLIDHLWYLNNIDDLRQKMLRNAFIFGESYCFVLWDKSKGDLHPGYLKGKALGLIEESEYSEDVRIGDITYQVEVPWRVLLQRKKDIKDVEYCFRVSVEATETLKKDYPELDKKIKTTENVRMFDTEQLTQTLLEEQTVVYEMYHKHTKHCSKGYYVKFTKDVLLEKDILPFSHGNLPFIRFTDMDLPEKLNGVSTYELVAPIQRMHDNLSTLLAKNIYLMGHAKWVMPRGACKVDSLGNDNTIIQYQGPVPPQMIQVRPNPPEAYNFRNMLRDEMGQIYGVQGVSRGAPPQGITAAVALQFLNEQEQERNSTTVIKHNDMIKDLAKMTIAVCGDYYDSDDGRMVRIVGKNNKYNIKHFDAANLHKSYDVRLQLGTGLPESKAGKLQRIVEIMQMKPDLLSNERWVDLLDLGDSEKMNSLITVALRTAESENEDILQGKFVSDPEDFEDHIIHWKVHTKAVQDRSFKEECPPLYRQELLEHIAIHEFLMVEKAQQNPLFQSKLAELPLFPMFPNGFTPLSKEQQTLIVQGQANKGEPITGQVPGEDRSEIQENSLKGEKYE